MEKAKTLEEHILNELYEKDKEVKDIKEKYNQLVNDIKDLLISIGSLKEVYIGKESTDPLDTNYTTTTIFNYTTDTKINNLETVKNAFEYRKEQLKKKIEKLSNTKEL